MPAPQISILMTVHNGEAFLEDAIRSLFKQTLREIEIIVVDDASSDATAGILARLAAEDSRLRVETLGENLGAFAAANHGLERATAPLVARLDADDIAHPERLERQAQVMRDAPELMVVAASVRQINSKGRVLSHRVRNWDDDEVRWYHALVMPFVHPTMMFRRMQPDGTPWRYDDSRRIAQDYDFAARLIEAGKARVLPDILVDYRVHDAQISSTSLGIQRKNGAAIAAAIQSRTLPPEIVEALEPVFQALYEGVHPDLEACMRGLETYTSHRSEGRPDVARKLTPLAAEMLYFLIATTERQTPQRLWRLIQLKPGWFLPYLRWRFGQQSKGRNALPQS